MKKATMKVFAVGVNDEEYDDTLYAKLEDAVKDFMDIVIDDMEYVEKEEAINEVKHNKHYTIGKYHIDEKTVIL